MKKALNFWRMGVVGGTLLISSAGWAPPPVTMSENAYNSVNHNTTPQGMNALDTAAPFQPGQSIPIYVVTTGGDFPPPGPTIVGGTQNTAQLLQIQAPLQAGVNLTTAVETNLTTLFPPAPDILTVANAQRLRLGLGPNATVKAGVDGLSIMLMGGPNSTDIRHTLQVSINDLESGSPNLHQIVSDLAGVIGPATGAAIYDRLQTLIQNIGSGTTIAGGLNNQMIRLENVFFPPMTVTQAIDDISVIMPPGSNSDILSGLQDTQAIAGSPPGVTTLPDQLTASLNLLNTKLGGAYTNIWDAVNAIP